MEPTFQSKLWKLAAVSSYLGMHMGIILITAVVPLVFICMGESDLSELAEHVFSMKHWLFGVGGVTSCISTFSVISTIVKKRCFRITMTILLIMNVLSVFGLLVWGLLPTESRKTYFQEAWNEMEPNTKEIIQKHYSCCGFNKAERGSVKNCYANETLDVYWPYGCYDRITSLIISAPLVKLPNEGIVTMGTKKMNVLLLGFLVPFVLVILIQSLTTVLFIGGLCKNQTSPDQKEMRILEVHENGRATGPQNENLTSGNSPAVANCVTKTNSTDVAVPVKPESVKGNKNCFSELGNMITSRIENSFYWLGVRVAQNPKTTILLCLLLAGTLSVGLLQRKVMSGGAIGFLPDDSRIMKNFMKYSMIFSDGKSREQFMLIEDEDNLLEANKFKAMLQIDIKIKNINSTDNTFADICTRVAGKCKERSLFELWNHDEALMNSLTTEDILERLNSNLTSLVFGDEIDINTILGEISRSSDGKISGAKAHLMTYYNGALDLDWELQFIEIGNTKYEDFYVYVRARESYIMEIGRYQSELPLLFGGFCLIFIYILLMTGKFSLLQHRTYIALMGVVTAGLSIAAGIGLAGSLGFKWNVIHLVAPFLIIGIGVDDMFIILQAWNMVDDDPELKDKSIHEKAGLALKRAGASITITSVTDLAAFAVGISSGMLTFSSFCVYVTICIIFLFILQCTFFLACTVVDQRRREERYDACLACCYKHKESYKPSKCSQRELFPIFFEDGLGRVVQYFPVQIIVIISTLVLTSVMIWAFSMLKVGYDNNWYLPMDSYIHGFEDHHKTYFSGGLKASVAVIGADFYEEREKLHLLYERLRTNENLNPKYLRSWFENYAYWMASENNITDLYAEDAFSNYWEFYETVDEFLKGKGKIFSSDITRWSGIIVGSKFSIRHKDVENGVDDVDIMDSIRNDCDEIGFSGAAFPLDGDYFILEVMKILRKEVYMNLGITLLCVFIVVLPMIASIQMSFWVALCVLFTTIDVAGTMYFAGFYIEPTTIIVLSISIGLAIDYAAHVAHKFLTLKGTRNMRVRITLGQIGPAVFNGGFSTLLALVLLAGSNSYAYRIFFTVFVCVVVFGLWNGLVFLPCVLGLFGPDPHKTAEEAKLSQRHYERRKKREIKDSEEDQMTAM